MFQTSKPRRKRRIPPLNETSARSAIGPIDHNTEIYGVTDGSVSLIDILTRIATELPNSNLTLATWTAANGDLTKAEGFLTSARVSELQLIVDPSFATRKPESCQIMRNLFGPDCIRFVPLHAKFAIFTGSPKGEAVLRTSMNLNPNNRLESYEISTDPDMVAFHQKMTEDIFSHFEPATGNPSNSRKQTQRIAAGEKPVSVLPF